MTSKQRKQCSKCPWKVSTNPSDIPDGYSLAKHRALGATIAEPGSFGASGMRLMACHETLVGDEVPCVGWLVQQLGPGNNIPLRLAVSTGSISAHVRTVGEQHERFEDTLPGDGQP